MPLLGRHKATSGSSSAAAATSSAAAGSSPAPSERRPAALCESPLFGVRRQLGRRSSPPSPVASQSSGSGSSLAARRARTRSASPANKQLRQQQAATAAAAAEPLSTIPQQMSRQQIHYTFSIMDSNRDGMVDLRDLSQMLANLGVPIDEAILAHIMSKTVSKRGESRISEAEFIDWIAQFIQVVEAPIGSASASATATAAATPTAHSALAGRRSGARAHSSRAPSSLGAQLAEAEAPVSRQRRGSGSGLALMRPLERSASASSSSSSGRAQGELSELEEARNDLKAAFGVFDIDGDGFITLEEVRAGLKLLGESWTPAELANVFARCSSPAARSPSDLAGQRISIDDFVRLLL